MGERDVVLEYLAVHEKSEDHDDAAAIVKKRRRTKVLKPLKLQVTPEKEQTDLLNVKTSLSKFTRSASNLSILSADEQQASVGITRRPIQNRVKLKSSSEN